MAPLVRQRGIATKSPREAVTGVEIAFACLPSPEVSRAVAFARMAQRREWPAHLCRDVDRRSKTVKAIAAELAKSNITVLDSPVSGGPRGARAGTLCHHVSGDRTAFERCKPMYDALARNAFYVGGEPGLAQVTKVANNMISAAGMVAVVSKRQRLP